MKQSPKIPALFHLLYAHMLITRLKLIDFHGKKYVLSSGSLRFPGPEATELGMEEYDELLERYGIFV